MKKQNAIIIGVIALVLTFAVGYALFSQTLSISGTAKASAEFDVKFESISDIQKDGYEDAEETDGANIATIKDNGHTLTVTVDKLTYPGAYVKIPVKVKNYSSMAVKLESIAESNNIREENSGEADTSSPIDVTYSGKAATDAEIAAGEESDLVITVTWRKNYGEAEGETPDAVKNGVEKSFSLKLNYIQAVSTSS